MNVFGGERGGAHQPIVCVESHVQTTVEVLAEGMRSVGFGDASLHVAGQAHFECDAAVVDVLGEVRILYQASAMPDPIGATRVDRLSNRFRTVAFPGMHRDAKVVL